MRLGSPGKSGVAHPHLVASLTQQFVTKFKLHFCLHSVHDFFQAFPFLLQLADEVSYLRLKQN